MTSESLSPGPRSDRRSVEHVAIERDQIGALAVRASQLIACDVPLRVLDRHRQMVKYVASGQTNSEPSLSSWVAALSRSSCNGIIRADPQWQLHVDSSRPHGGANGSSRHEAVSTNSASTSGKRRTSCGRDQTRTKPFRECPSRKLPMPVPLIVGAISNARFRGQVNDPATSRRIFPPCCACATACLIEEMG